MIILDSNGSVLRGYREKWTICDKEGLHLFTHGDGLTYNCIIKFNIFMACQTYQFQPELLFDVAAGLKFGDCIMFRK